MGALRGGMGGGCSIAGLGGEDPKRLKVVGVPLRMG